MLASEVFLLVLWLFFLLTLLIYTGITFIMRYHWKAYALEEETMHRISSRYSHSSLSLLGITVCLLLAYTVSTLL